MFYANKLSYSYIRVAVEQSSVTTNSPKDNDRSPESKLKTSGTILVTDWIR